MIYSLRGKLISVEPNLAVVECAGVGYAVRTSSVTVSRLPALGSEVMLYTYLHLSENAIDLFGFADPGELSCFKMLIAVTRVGPKAALSVLWPARAALPFFGVRGAAYPYPAASGCLRRAASPCPPEYPSHL